MKIGNLNVTAVELDPNKQYVFLLDRSIPAYELIEFLEAVRLAGLKGLVWRGPMNIIDFDQIKGYIEVPDAE